MAECSGNCAVWVEDVNTIRGCEADKPEEIRSFKSCEETGCNNIIFPEERIKCVSCSEDDDFCVEPTADLLYPCKNYMENDKCYTFVISE